jgi:hypothetical protein
MKMQHMLVAGGWMLPIRVQKLELSSDAMKMQRMLVAGGWML